MDHFKQAHNLSQVLRQTQQPDLRRSIIHAILDALRAGIAERSPYHGN